MGAVKSEASTSPVLRTPAGSKQRISASSSAAVRCSKARRHDDQFPRCEGDYVIPELDSKGSAPDEEEFIFGLVLVPGKDALDFDQLQLLTVQPGDRLGTPVL